MGRLSGPLGDSDPVAVAPDRPDHGAVGACAARPGVTPSALVPALVAGAA
ncbi:hypothetical protein [Streptomyces sp. NPDC056921]